MAKYDYGSDEKLQEWIGKQQTSVTKAMMTGGGPLTRAYRGGKAFAKSKMKSPWSERKDVEQDVFSETLSKGLRLFGKTKAAEWVDRFTARTKFPTDKAKGPKEPTSKVGDVQVSNQGMMKELTTIKGSLVRIESNVGLLNAAVMDTREDVSDIKKLLMPTNLVASGEGDKYGEQQYVQYNPLAPKGSQFLKQQTLEIEGEPVRGKLINRAPDEEFMQSAIRMAAVETASTILRIQRKDEKKQQQIMRRRRNLANDTWAYSDPTEPDRDFFKKFIDDAGGKVETVEKEDDGILDDAIDIGIGAAIASALPGALKAALSGAAGILAPALAAALPLGIMAAFTKFAETADINNPGNNPLALIGHYGLKFSQWARGESHEEFLEKQRQQDRELRDRASRGEIDMSVAQGKAPPGMHWEGNKLVPDNPVSSQVQYSPEQLEAYKGVIQQMRSNADTLEGLTDTQRQAMRDQADKLEQTYFGTRLQRKPDDPKTVKDFIVAGANRAGMDPRIMMAMAAQESGFNPNAQATTSSAKGLFQFINETWNHMKRKYGGEFTELDKGPFDPEASALAGALYARENAEFLKSAGLPVNATSLYTAHFLGPGGAKKVLEADPNMNADELLPNAARSNVGIFMKKEDGRFVPRTVGELQELLYQKIGSKVEQIGYQLTNDYGYNYKQYGTTPRWDADMMDQDSRMVAQDHRGGGSTPNVTLVTQTNPTRSPPPPAATTVPRATGLTSDDTLRNAGAADSVLPALS